jgi:hypothetical protein
VTRCDRRPVAREKLLPAVMAAEVVCLAVAIGFDCGRFIDLHPADGIDGHGLSWIFLDRRGNGCCSGTSHMPMKV